MSTESMSSVELNITECDIDKVIVYRDRAEIHRCFSLHPTNNGEYLIKIKDLTNSADMESIRVKGVKYGEILEVSHDTININASDTDTGDVESIQNELLKTINRIETDIEQKKQSMSRNNKKRDLIQTYTEGALGRSKDSTLIPLEHARMLKVLDYHSEQLEALDRNENEFKEELVGLRNELSIKKQELMKYSHRFEPCGVTSMRIINIMLNIKNYENNSNSNPEYEVHFSYVVLNSTWNASYDLRVNPGSANTPATMELYYYAEVIQSCGEDWNDCQLILSTSNPTIGASPPPLVSKEVAFEHSSHDRSRSRYKSERHVSFNNNSRDSDSDSDMHSLSLVEDDLNNLGGGGGGDLRVADNTAFASGSGFAVSSAVGSGDAGSTTFNIQRKVTIAADSKPHKVTITVQTLTPQIIHYVVPSESASVYLQAKTKNTSSYPILPSSKVSVYYDGNFISNSNLKQASSGESFNVFLGVDPAVKCDYMPVRVVNRVKGWLNGTEEKKYYHTTVLHNTKQTPCKVIVAEILPKSIHSKIVVDLLQPNTNQLNKNMNEQAISTDQLVDAIDVNTGNDWPSDFISHNKYTNNIIWLQSIKPGDKIELPFSYRISWSASDGTIKVIEK